MMNRKIGRFEVSALGLGCMSLSHGYATPPSADDGARVLNTALDDGYTLLDTAAMYGFGANETLLANSIMHRRDDFVLASKGGMFRDQSGQRLIDGRPQTLRTHCEASLSRLNTDRIDLYYLHRWDKSVPIEDSVGEMARLVDEGKVLELGLSEVSADTLRRAHAVHPIAALQTEYSLWTRNPEIAVLNACQQMGVAFVAFSPLGRGFLAGGVADSASLEPGDMRVNMPRFSADNLAVNLGLLNAIDTVAHALSATRAQVALAWCLAQGDHIVPIPGTADAAHATENWGALDVHLSADQLALLNHGINQSTVVGGRYTPVFQAEIDTETF